MRLYLFLIATLLSSASVKATPLEQQRSDFLRAEKLLAQGNNTAFLAFSHSLRDYPLYPALQYRWLRKRLTDSTQVQAFLQHYANSYYAELLRLDWLRYLFSQTRWQDFMQYYHVNDGVAFGCQFYWAHYQSGNAPVALTEAKRLWLTGDDLPKACQPLLSVWLNSPLASSNLIWQRFETALKKDHVALAVSLRPLLSKIEQSNAALWLAVQKNPALVAAPLFVSSSEPHLGRLFAYGVDRLARSHLHQAIALWDARKTAFIIDEDSTHALERKLALALARQRDAQAYSRLDALTHADTETKEWQLRAALLEQSWRHVAHVLSGLSTDELAQAKWQYWQARTLALAGNRIQSQQLYQQLARNRSLYGFLAADRLHKPYNLSDKPIIPVGDELEQLAQETDFKMIQELRLLDRLAEAKQHWWFSIKHLSQARQLLAAKLAERWQWQQVAILTLVKADYWDDLALRFPVRYLSAVQTQAEQQQLNPALVFALMRQESMLDEKARSPVGARGLMQLMPKTAQGIANQLNEPWQTAEQLFNPELNIKYGSFYYKQLLHSFNGNLALATAAYNAGPGRVAQWLPNTTAMSSDSWIETIPFKETRQYVFSVLAYAIIYQQRLLSEPLTLTALLPDLLPTKN